MCHRYEVFPIRKRFQPGSVLGDGKFAKQNFPSPSGKSARRNECSVKGKNLGILYSEQGWLASPARSGTFRVVIIPAGKGPSSKLRCETVACASLVATYVRFWTRTDVRGWRHPGNLASCAVPKTNRTRFHRIRRSLREISFRFVIMPKQGLERHQPYHKFNRISQLTG